MVTFEVQIGRRDRAVKILMRRARRGRGARRPSARLGLPRTLVGSVDTCASAALPNAATAAALVRRSRRDTFMGISLDPR
jgi:hypothetical protein